MDPQERVEEMPKPTRPTLPDDYGVPTDVEGLLDWEWVVERLEKATNYWVCTVRPDGRPHAVPVWAVWLRGTLYLDGHPQTVWKRNLAQNPAIGVHLESGSQVVILEGNAQEIETFERPRAEEIAGVFSAKYGGKAAATVEELVRRGIYTLRPKTALAWSEFPRTVTRWKFSETE